MSAAGFILAINLVVAGLFATAFVWVALYDRTRTAARWLVAAYLSGMAYSGLEALVAVSPYPRLTVLAAFATFLATLVFFAVGIARHYRVPVPWRLLAIVFFASLPLNYAIFAMERGSFWRVLLYQFPYFVLQAISAWLVLKAPARRWLDTLLAVFLLASALHFLSKAFLAVWLGPGSSAQDYIRSNYALVSQATGSVLIVASGILALVILVRGLLADATERSQTDALSGLLNRRGFEDRAESVLARVGAGRAANALVLADLDHFKSVNDTLGHGAGDRVIAGFGAMLRETLGDRHIAGRIGGEEFAVLLPGANAASARLFAEAIRNAYSAVPLEGLPSDLRITASFGVAEALPDETLSDLLRRADAALYAAKQDGRDRVRVARALRPVDRGRSKAG